MRMRVLGAGGMPPGPWDTEQTSKATMLRLRGHHESTETDTDSHAARPGPAPASRGRPGRVGFRSVRPSTATPRNDAARGLQQSRAALLRCHFLNF